MSEKLLWKTCGKVVAHLRLLISPQLSSKSIHENSTTSTGFHGRVAHVFRQSTATPTAAFS
jgi:hypothetical protein